MRCTHCNYALWNIRDRICPECGHPFKPSEHDFVPRAVRFLCPHCAHSYEGTSARGLIEPEMFDCVQCAQRVHIDEMILQPAAGYTEDNVTPRDIAWQHARRTGWLKAWFTTIGQSLFKPGRDPGESVRAAWVFMSLTHLVYAAISSATMMAFVAFTLVASLAAGPGAQDWLMLAGFIGVALAAIVGTVLGHIVAVGIWGALTHGLLRISGGTRKSLGTTYQCLCYSSAANVIYVVPCIGGYFGIFGAIWWAVSASIMLKRQQAVSAWRAALAVCLPLVLFVGAVVGLLVWLVIRPMTNVQMTGTLTTPAITSLSQDLADRAVAQGWPPHALELVADGTWAPRDTVLPWSATTTMNVGAGLLTIDEFADLSSQEQAALIDQQRLPDDVVAHRVGDVVFTWHGIDPLAGDPELWILIASPTPDLQWQGQTSMVVIGKLDGTTVEFFGDKLLQDALDDQNDLRAAHGLTPLILPSQITSTKPMLDDGQ